jgi:hypothetical protein
MQTLVEGLQYLTASKKEQLVRVLHSFPTLFGGGLGTVNIPPIHVELIDGAKPYHARAFPIPKAYEQGTQKEIDRFCQLGIMERSQDSEWATPTFIQPTKTGDICILTDFRKLNLEVKCKPFPLPKISKILLKLQGFRYATALDLSMGYYHIPLDEASQKLCTTILPWENIGTNAYPWGSVQPRTYSRQ